MRLDALADEMIAFARRRPYATFRRRLGRGATLAIIYYDPAPPTIPGAWRLTIAREGIAPGEKEIEIFRRAFKVPPSASRKNSASAVALDWTE